MNNHKNHDVTYKLLQGICVLLLLLACNTSQIPNPVIKQPTNSQLPEVVVLPVEAKSLLFTKGGSSLSQHTLKAQAINTTTIMGELGRLSVTQPNRATWYTINLTGTYNKPVVIMQSASANDADPVVIRLRNIASNTFEFQLQEWDYQDGIHGAETLSYLVVESGTHQLILDNGNSIKLEANTASIDSNGTNYFFEHYYPIADNAPVVFTQSQTVNEASTITTRQELLLQGGSNDIRYSGIELYVEEEEANGAHIAETVGIVAIEQGNGVTHGSNYAAALTDRLVNDNDFDINFPINLQSTQVIFLSSLQSIHGGDTAALRYKSLSQTGVTVYVDEEQSANVETGHTEEVIGYLAFQARFLSDDPIATESNLKIEEQRILKDNVAELGQVLLSQKDRNTWHKLNTLQKYTNPVVIMQPASYNGADPATYRLKNVATNSFEFQLQEWDYQDGNHPEERISYMVAELGRHTINSLTMNVAKLNVNSNFATHNFAPAFTSTPVVLAQSQTVNEEDAITVNLKDISPTALTIRLQEEEAKGAHAFESVGYIALTQGSGVLNPALGNRPINTRDTKNYVVATKNADSQWDSINFPASLATPYAAGLERNSDYPFFLAGIQTTNGGNTTSLRFRNLSYSDTEVFIEDEQSNDIEQHHIIETVGYAVFDSGFGYPITTPFPSGWLQTELNGSVAESHSQYNSHNQSFNQMVVHSGQNDSQATNYIYQKRSGTTTLEACIQQREGANADDKGGIMLRSDNDADAFYAYIGMTAAGTSFEYRNTYTDLVQYLSGALNSIPSCLRLVYNGSGGLRAFESTNGAVWIGIASISIDLGTSYSAGLSTSTADFTSFTEFNTVKLLP